MIPAPGVEEQVAEAAAYIQATSAFKVPKIGIILGTGMGSLAGDLQDSAAIDYATIPNFPVSTVESHAGKLHFGTLAGKPVVMMQGRFHFYEGYTMQQVVLPVRVMHRLGINTLIVMNACGSLNPEIKPGALVIASDYINFLGNNPLVGPNADQFGVRFPDMSQPFDLNLIEAAEKAAKKEGLSNVHKGIMVAVTGPSFSTPAEYRLLRKTGADTVTMSSVPEVITARHAGLRVLTISIATDYCMPDNLKPLTLPEILNVAANAQPLLSRLVKQFCLDLNC